MTPLEEIACKCLQKEMSGVFVNNQGKKCRLREVEDRLWVFLEEKTDVIYYVNDLNRFTSVFIPDTKEHKTATSLFENCPTGKDGRLHATIVPLLNSEYAEAFQALAKLILYRKAVVKNWEPAWDIPEKKWSIMFEGNRLTVATYSYCQRVLSFPDFNMATDFMREHKDLCEKAKPLL